MENWGIQGRKGRVARGEEVEEVMRKITGIKSRESEGKKN